MMKNQEKALKNLNAIVKPDSGTWKKDTQWRKENKTWLRKSQKIAFKILRVLREQKKTQKDLAELMEVSPQQVNKWVKGKENFTLETLSRLEEVLDINLLATDYKEKLSSEKTEDNFIFRTLISRKEHESLTFNTVKEYLAEKDSPTKLQVDLHKYRNTIVHTPSEQNYFTIGLRQNINFNQKVSKLWTFETEKFEAGVIELKPVNKATKRINSNDLIAAEPASEYY